MGIDENKVEEAVGKVFGGPFNIVLEARP